MKIWTIGNALEKYRQEKARCVCETVCPTCGIILIILSLWPWYKTLRFISKFRLLEIYVYIWLPNIRSLPVVYWIAISNIQLHEFDPWPNILTMTLTTPHSEAATTCKEYVCSKWWGLYLKYLYNNEQYNNYKIWPYTLTYDLDYDQSWLKNCCSMRFICIPNMRSVFVIPAEYRQD